MLAWSSARYTFPLPEGHRFPIAKYARLRERVISDGVLRPADLREPERVTREALLLAHTADYIDRFMSGGLAPDETRRRACPGPLRSLSDRSEPLVARVKHALPPSIPVSR